MQNQRHEVAGKGRVVLQIQGLQGKDQGAHGEIPLDVETIHVREAGGGTSGIDTHERISAGIWTMTMNQIAKVLALGPN